jgi:malonyl-CoA O-methyltransferase
VAEPGEAFRLDRVALRASFERAAAGRGGGAAGALQESIVSELLARVAAFSLEPEVVLDLGAGTGGAARELARRYGGALVIALDFAAAMLRAAERRQRLWRRFARVCGDALRLPLKSASVDLVFCSLTLEWCEPLALALAEVRRVLKPTGLFAFSTLGPATLSELRSAWAQADGYNHVNYFHDMHEVGDALVHSGLMEPVLDADRIELRYRDARTLMRELKALGAHNVTAGRPRALAGRARLESVQQAYESCRRDSGLPATCEVIYGASWGAPGRPAAAADAGVVRIAPGSIGRARP